MRALPVLIFSAVVLAACNCGQDVIIGGSGGGTGTGGNGTGGTGTGGNMMTGGGSGMTGGGNGMTGGGSGGGTVFIDPDPEDAGPSTYDGGCGPIDAGDPTLPRRCLPAAAGECDGPVDQALT